jgi:hypothetical protein
MRSLLCHANGRHASWRAAVTQHYAVKSEEKPYLLLERCTQICYAHVQSYALIKDC